MDSFKFKDSYVATGHGAVVAGKINLAFAQLYQQNQPQSNEGTMPFSLKKKQTSLRHTFATSVCGAVSAISGRKGVPGFIAGYLSD